MEWLTLILPFLQPIIMKCFDRTSSEDPQEFLRENYDPVSGRMDRDVVEMAMPSMRKSIHKAHRHLPKKKRDQIPKLSRQDLYDATEKSLIESMNEPPEKVAEIRVSAELLPDND